MSIPVPTFTTTGLSVPSETDIKAGVWALFQDAFGGRLNESDATPQGQLVTSITAALGASNDLLLQYTNLVDPALSSGRMQDAIARIYYLERIPATQTIATCTCTGAADTVIPQGSLAMAGDGTIYYSLARATIGSDGTASVDFAAINTGPIACSAGSLNTIYRSVPGWDAITNPADGILGRDEETAAAFEARRAQSVAANATGILQAVKGAVLGVKNVVDVYVTENPTGSAVTIGGVSVAARSIYVAVQGGNATAIANAIWSKKPPGCNMTGSTSITVQDKTGYATPYPSYTVKFQRPSSKPIYFAVTLADNGQVPADATTQVQDAILAAWAGEDGGQAAKIGATIYALRFAAAVAALGTWAQLVSIKIGTTSTPTSDSVSVNINEWPTLARANIVTALA
jgi:hypothetical protein